MAVVGFVVGMVEIGLMGFYGGVGLGEGVHANIAGTDVLVLEVLYAVGDDPACVCRGNKISSRSTSLR